MAQGPVLKRLRVLFGELGGGSSDYIGQILLLYRPYLLPTLDNLHNYFTMKFNVQNCSGESISISAHSLQAGHIALQHFIFLNTTVDSELVLASLLHDIGHMLGWNKLLFIYHN